MKSLIIKSSVVFALLIGMTTASFALPACPSSGFFNNCFGTYYYLVGLNKGDKYLGEWQNDKRHGQGTYIWTNGEKYIGEWQNDERYGWGTNTFANGEKYEGEWQNDKRHGQGTYIRTNGEKYIGEYKDDQRHGQGTYTFVNGEKYVGEWQNDKRYGRGTNFYADGSIYQEGIFKDDKFLYVEKNSNVDKHKHFCEEIGFIPKTESFGNCVLELMKKD